MDRLNGRELADYPGQRLRVQPSQVQDAAIGCLAVLPGR